MQVNVEPFTIELKEFLEEDALSQQLAGYFEKYPVLKQALAAAFYTRESSFLRGHPFRVSDLACLGAMFEEIEYRPVGEQEWFNFPFLTIVTLIQGTSCVWAEEIKIFKELIPGEIKGQGLVITGDLIQYQAVFTVSRGCVRAYRMLTIEGLNGFCFPLDITVTPMGWTSKRDRAGNPLPLKNEASKITIPTKDWVDSATQDNQWDKERLRVWIKARSQFCPDAVPNQRF